MSKAKIAIALVGIVLIFATSVIPLVAAQAGIPFAVPVIGITIGITLGILLLVARRWKDPPMPTHPARVPGIHNHAACSRFVKKIIPNTFWS